MTQLASDAIERLELYEDHAVLGDLTFALEGAHDLAERPDAFLLHKSRAQLDEYVDLFRAFPSFAPEHVLELGIWNGGSTVMWFELFRPRKHVAVDIADRGDDEAFRRFVDDRGAEERLQTYWSTDQADARRMQQIVALSFAQPLDIVIDDASHLYEPTKSSFEALFPLLAE